MKIQFFHLASLSRAAENVREPDTAAVDALAASIQAFGLKDPLQGYTEGDGARIEDGGTRLDALFVLAATRAGKAALKRFGLIDKVPVIIREDRAEARARSLVSFHRSTLHPVDELFAYKALADEGKDAEEIARACAVKARRVRQLLRLMDVAPEILAACRAGELGLDVVEAFTLSTDQDAQRKLLADLAAAGKVTVQAVRAALREGTVHSNDKLALFVGRDAYAAAGGTFQVDLFSIDAEEVAPFKDGALLRRLAADKLAGVVAEVQAEGWGHVSAVEGWEWSQGFNRVTWNDDEIEAMTPEVRAELHAFVRIVHAGEVSISRAYRPSEEKPAQAEGQAKSPAQAAAQADPRRFGFGHGGHHKLTQVATSATRAALLQNPEAAYDGLLVHLAWTTFRGRGHGQGVSTLAPVSPQFGNRPASISVAGDELYAEAWQVWHDRLPRSPVAFCEAVAALTPADKAQLLAFCFAGTLNAAEEKVDGHKPPRWAMLGWVAKRAEVDVGAVWTPDAAFLKSASKSLLLEIARQLGARGENWVEAKKGELADWIEKQAAKTGWTPELLAKLTEVSAEGEVEPIEVQGEAQGEVEDGDAYDMAAE